MGILLAFAPFVVFAVADKFSTAVIALAAGALTSAILVGRDVAGVCVELHARPAQDGPAENAVDPGV